MHRIARIIYLGLFWILGVGVSFSQAQTVDPVLQEFLDIADILQFVDGYYTVNPDTLAQGEQRLVEINEALAIPPKKFVTKVGDSFQVSLFDLSNSQQALSTEKMILLRNLAMYYIMLGDLDKAIPVSEEAHTLSLAEYVTLQDKIQVEMARGTVYLRKAETDNCLNNNNNECCVFPLTGGGIHQSKAAAEKARECFLQVLQYDPNDSRSKWLLNILAMALDSYPESVDPAYRIPPSALTSDYDIGKFPNVAKSAGVDYFGLAGGTVALDYNNDGFLDIAASSWGDRDPLQLYRNKGDGTFENVSISSGTANQLGGLQINGTDYNNDGLQDLMVLRGAWRSEFGQIRNSLLRNNGNGTFSDVTYSAGMATPAYPSQSAAWGDFNNDGELDLAKGNEGWPGQLDYPCQLFVNNGDGTFTDVAASAGMDIVRFVKGLCVGDYDNDNYLDIFMSTRFSNSVLFHNNGDMTFTNVADAAGVSGGIEYSTPTGTDFPSWFFDYNNDGWLDIFIAAFSTSVDNVYKEYMGIPQTFRRPRLYRNNQDGTFTEVTDAVGLLRPIQVMGASFGDLDNDGWLDMFLTTGDPVYTSLYPDVMLRNNQAQSFQDVSLSGGFGSLQKGHGVCFVDLDNDGDQDVYHVLGGAFPSDKYYNALFLNPGHGNHFLHLNAIGTSSNRLAVGTRVKVTVNTPTGIREIHRAIGSNSSFGNTPYRTEIGLGNATAIQSVELWWPKTDLRQTLTNVPLDVWIEVTEGQPGFLPKTLTTFQFNTALKSEASFLQVKSP